MILKMNLLYEYFYNRESLAFFSSYFTTLVTFIFVQPKQDQNPYTGFNLIAYNKSHCYHIHHWVYMIILATTTIFFIFQSNGKFNSLNLFFIAFLLGGASSDLAYNDLFVFHKDCPYNPLIPKISNMSVS